MNGRRIIDTFGNFPRKTATDLFQEVFLPSSNGDILISTEDLTLKYGRRCSFRDLLQMSQCYPESNQWVSKAYKGGSQMHDF